MKHLGDITKINGAEIEPVDVITGGSPCQDLSIAGKRAGLAGARSGLFMEQIRIVKEMREADKRNGRTGNMVRPRYMVWENVPGAFSSNKGQDFAAVLEEIIRIAEPEAPNIEVPEKGWNTWGGYHDEVGGRWSVAWRVHDAQHWGVPQRRRRISIVADFGGDTAGEISFERKSLPGNSAPRGAAGEEAAGDFGAGAGYAIPINDKATRYAGGGSSRNHDGSGNGLGVGKDGDPSPMITAGDRHIVCSGFKAGNGAKANNIGYAEECAPTLSAVSNGTNQVPAVLLDMSHANDVIRERGEIAPSLQARMGTGGNQVPLTYQMQGFGDYREGDTASSCKQRDYKDSTDLIVKHMVVRRLTPMECERLQGYPDGWTDIGEWHDSKGKLHKDADSPRYKACGNSIALPFWSFLAKRISAQYIRPVTMGSLFDGIGGFPLVFERCNGKGTARWASEIEEFPIAVTKLRFGEE